MASQLDNTMSNQSDNIVVEESDNIVVEKSDTQILSKSDRVNAKTDTNKQLTSDTEQQLMTDVEQLLKTGVAQLSSTDMIQPSIDTDTQSSNNTVTQPSINIVDFMCQLKLNYLSDYNTVTKFLKDNNASFPLSSKPSYLLYELFTKTDDLTLLDKLVKMGLEFDDPDQTQKLFADVYEKKNLDKFKLLTQQLGSENITELCKSSKSLLKIIACRDWTDGMSHLCSGLIDVNILDKSNNPMLYYAVINKMTSVVKELLQLGADPNAEVISTVGPIAMISYSMGTSYNKEIPQLLLAAGANFYNIEKYYQTHCNKSALKHFIDNNFDNKIRFLGENGYNMDLYDTDGTHYLNKALLDGKISIANAIIPYCKVFCPINDTGESVLHYYVDNLYINRCNAKWTGDIKLIIQNKNFDINCVQSEGKTALRYALALGLTEIAQLLIDAGADINIAGKDGCTALMRSAENGYEDSVKLAIKYNANVNAVDINGMTALYILCKKCNGASNKYYDIAKILLEAGAVVSHTKIDGMSMFDHAKCSTQYTELLQKYCLTKSKKLVDDKGNVYEPIVKMHADAVCEIDDGDSFPQYQLLCYPAGEIKYKEYDETNKMWGQFSMYKNDSGMEIQYTLSESLRYHVMVVDNNQIRIQFDEICLPNGEKYQFKYY